MEVDLDADEAVGAEPADYIEWEYTRHDGGDWYGPAWEEPVQRCGSLSRISGVAAAFMAAASTVVLLQICRHAARSDSARRSGERGPSKKNGSLIVHY